MPTIPAMHSNQFVYIAAVIATLPLECRNLVAWRFARAFMGTNRNFHMANFIKACGCEMGTVEKEVAGG